MSDNRAWYRKYRPTTMDQYKGQKIRDVVKKRFTNPESRPQTIMIHGERGCGKTTFARIIDKYYLCTNPNPDGTPCEHCEMCTEINESLIEETSDLECTAVKEIDATIANKKEDIQEIMDEARVAPMYSNYTILVFDECHMITAAAQNSLLKTLEDIPKHLIIIFATTDPDKVLPTIHSRCQVKLEVAKQSVEDMADRLQEISEAEGLTVSREALEMIAKRGDRVPRECINLLEDVAKNNDGIINVKNVQNIIGGINVDFYSDYFKAANSSLEDTLMFVRSLRDKNIQAKNFVSGLSKFIMDALYIRHGIGLKEYGPDFVKGVKVLFETYKSNEFDMLLQIVERTAFNIKDDDAVNEIALTLMAMRISKIELLANGLAEEQEQGVVENKVSLAEHSKYVQESHAVIAEDERIDIGEGQLRETFNSYAKPNVSDEFMRALSNIDLPKVPELKVDEEKIEENPLDSIDL